MQIFVKSIESFNSPVYFAPPCSYKTVLGACQTWLRVVAPTYYGSVPDRRQGLMRW